MRYIIIGLVVPLWQQASRASTILIRICVQQMLQYAFVVHTSVHIMWDYLLVTLIPTILAHYIIYVYVHHVFHSEAG